MPAPGDIGRAESSNSEISFNPTADRPTSTRPVAFLTDGMSHSDAWAATDAAIAALTLNEYGTSPVRGVEPPWSDRARFRYRVVATLRLAAAIAFARPRKCDPRTTCCLCCMDPADPPRRPSASPRRGLGPAASAEPAQASGP
jgi:hypothetical protein